VAIERKKVIETTRRVRSKRDRDASPEVESAADLAELITKVGADAKAVALWRMDAGAEKYLGRVGVDEFSLDHVAEKYGGGKFRARIVGAANTFVKGGGITFDIEGVAKVPSSSPATSTAAAPAGLPPWLTQLLVATVPAIGAAIVTRMLARPEPDPILLAMLNKKGGDTVSPGELVTMLDNARREAREDTRAMMELAGDRGGDGGAGWPDVVRDSLPKLLEAFNNQTDNGRRATARIAEGGEVKQRRQAGTAPAPAVPQWVARIRPHLATVISWADSGKTPEVKAASVVDDLPKAEAASIAAHSQTPAFIDEVFAYLPELESTPARREWFTQFLLEIQDAYTPEGERCSHGVALLQACDECEATGGEDPRAKGPALKVESGGAPAAAATS
jgi:hypothetical protein